MTRAGQRALKRLMDILVSATLLIVCAPVMLIVALAVRLDSSGPILFRQQRPGLRGKPFTLAKFRTMREARGADGKLLPDAERLTPLGRFLRATSLDELPEFWNVLTGEMSLVGPRPLYMSYLGRYTPEQARRHDVKPGITGWAQVNGRNALDWETRFRLDVYYVDHWSLGFDLRILARTVWTVLKRDGISHPDQATMKEFMGTEEKARG